MKTSSATANDRRHLEHPAGQMYYGFSCTNFGAHLCIIFVRVLILSLILSRSNFCTITIFCKLPENLPGSQFKEGGEAYVSRCFQSIPNVTLQQGLCRKYFVVTSKRSPPPLYTCKIVIHVVDSH